MPLLIMIQGSGCATVLKTQGGETYSTLFGLLPFAAEGKFAVLAVEKPYADPNFNGQAGTATNCSSDFNSDFTADRWLSALEAAVNDAARQPWVDKRRALAFGMSEGAVMAALLAGHDKRITDVVAVGGSGTTQLFDLIVGAYQRCFDRSACIADIENQVRAINAAPDSSSQFAWGHPFKRWASFFRVDAGDELLRSHARAYLAFGTADTNVPALSQEVAVAKLLGAGHDVTVRRVPDANHALMTEGKTDLEILRREYRAALAWFSSTPVR